MGKWGRFRDHESRDQQYPERLFCWPRLYQICEPRRRFRESSLSIWLLANSDVTVDGAGPGFVLGLPLFTGLNTLTLKSSQGGFLTFGSEGSPLQVHAVEHCRYERAH